MSEIKFDKLVKDLEDAPMTWMPALLQVVVKQSLKKEVFKDIIRYVANIVVQTEKKPPIDCKDHTRDEKSTS